MQRQLVAIFVALLDWWPTAAKVAAITFRSTDSHIQLTTAGDLPLWFCDTEL